MPCAPSRCIPIDYLVVPRTLAMMVSMPLLVAEAVAIGSRPDIRRDFLLEINGTYYIATWCAGHDARHHHGADQGICFLRCSLSSSVATRPNES